ncbi:hypothetical protein M378DRAFT_28837 [Amanita muscaria Koide BX008]|uniref:Uncharacterized protein n=1 Tax=Amanita muscaria (strain Koide BX008) TaxID=946122 RepID=A0A0C2VYL8_AMAMK|nr:hypothetical protein M378DRAFT_28837 [Amanita muscaria Koide BX008]
MATHFCPLLPFSSVIIISVPSCIMSSVFHLAEHSSGDAEVNPSGNTRKLTSLGRIPGQFILQLVPPRNQDSAIGHTEFTFVMQFCKRRGSN